MSSGQAAVWCALLLLEPFLPMLPADTRPAFIGWAVDLERHIRSFPECGTALRYGELTRRAVGSVLQICEIIAGDLTARDFRIGADHGMASPLERARGFLSSARLRRVTDVKPIERIPITRHFSNLAVPSHARAPLPPVRMSGTTRGCHNKTNNGR
jgi:hypothetical protein